MSFGGDNAGSQKRKVLYDDYTGSFYTESKMESLQRQCDYRGKMADVLNRSEEAKLSSKKKTVYASQNIFEMKNEREATIYKENLKDHRAYKQVLENILKEREKDSSWDDKYGMYGGGINRNELEQEVMRQKHEMTPSVLRKRNADFLLSQRKRVEVFDRNAKTPELLSKIRKRRAAKEASQQMSPEETSRPTPKLILPPITVSLRKEGSPNITANDVKISGSDVNDVTGFPSVFITQHRSPI